MYYGFDSITETINENFPYSRTYVSNLVLSHAKGCGLTYWRLQNLEDPWVAVHPATMADGSGEKLGTEARAMNRGCALVDTFMGRDHRQRCEMQGLC
jgi:hypothetical protein